MTVLFDKIRRSCKRVSDESEWVRIDYDAIPAHAGTLPLERLAEPEIDPGRHYLGHGEDTLAFFIILDTINFGSGYFPFLKKRPGMSGYFTVASRLTDYFNTHGPLSAHGLAGLTAGDCTRIFHQDDGISEIRELMGHFAAALNDLGAFLLQGFNGRFSNVIEAAGNSAERLAGLLIQMPMFEDTAVYKGSRVHFYKRAQLTAADLALAFDGRGPGRFDDLHELTIFADNLVPHVLRKDRILIYDDDLARRIDTGELISSGSGEEIEIRACAVHAVELIKSELEQKTPGITAMQLDYLLWNRGQQPEYKAVPRHRCRTCFY